MRDTDRYRVDRRRFLTGVSAAGFAGLAGCSGGPTDGETDTTTEGEDNGGMDTTTEGGMDGSESVAVGVVYATGGLGDGSFNDQAQQGFQAAQDEFDMTLDTAQPEEVADFKNFQQQFASSSDPDYDLVSCIGFLQTDALSETAPEYPDQDFMIVDSVVDESNVRSYTFKEHEGSYLVGQLAGLLTTQSFSAGGGSTQSDSTNVGFVGGVESDLIGRFQAGYEAGVKAANADVDIQTSYVGDFNDPAGGREAAQSMYNSGADVVYHAAGNTGTGVFQAAQDQGRFAIGVDRDQSVTRADYADVILASMVKRVDTATFNSVEATVEGNFEGGTVVSLGLAEEGVGIVYGQNLGSEVSEDVKSAIESSRQGIIDGEIDVPTDPDEVSG